ncbi:MAG TPA: WG repeat-containing protein, partial [Pseudorhodoplanes sp.]|nr:WG repeat-containing protein [Pseudorhodoplanes sp.]
AEILVGNKTGVINRKGEIVVPPMFKRAIPLTKDVIIAVEGTWTSSHYLGFEKLENLKEDTLTFEKPGLYHVGGYWVRKPDLKRVSRFELEGRGLLWASIRGERADLFGLLASDGTWVVEPQYEYAAALTDGLAIVRKTVDGTVLSGAVDVTGQLVVPLQARSLFYWSNGWGLARESAQSGKEALLDTKGNVVGGRYFDKVERGGGDVATVLLDGRWVGLDRAGNIVSHPRNGQVYASCPGGVRLVWLDGKMQITDANGQPTAPYLFEQVHSKPNCDRPFSVQLNGKRGFVGLDGRLLFDPPGFDNQYGFEGGYAVVQQDKKWGIIDTSGRFVLTPKFDELVGDGAGLFRAKLQGRQFWIAASGEERPEPPIKYTAPPSMLDCGHGLKLIVRDGAWGIADADGKDVIAPRYRALSCFKNGIAWAPIDSRRQWCAIGPDGAMRDEPACRVEHYPYITTHSSPEKFHEDRFENSVLWSRAYLEFSAGQRDAPPRWISDGVRGSFSTIPQ